MIDNDSDADDADDDDDDDNAKSILFNCNSSRLTF